MSSSAGDLPNLLPKDGFAVYYGPILNPSKAGHYFLSLMKGLDWKQDELLIFGKRMLTKRKTAWHGDQAFQYTYSNSSKIAQPWTPELLELREIVELNTGTRFNSCLLNLYHSGEEGMSWHADNEKELGPEPIIASLSLGAERKFSFKHRENKNTVTLQLENGSLLLMKEATQKNWLHSLPKTKKVSEARINITFRNIMVPNKQAK